MLIAKFCLCKKKTLLVKENLEILVGKEHLTIGNNKENCFEPNRDIFFVQRTPNKIKRQKTPSKYLLYPSKVQLPEHSFPQIYKLQLTH